MRNLPCLSDSSHNKCALLAQFRAERNHNKGENDEDLAKAIQDSLNMNPYMPHHPYAPSQALPRAHRLATFVHHLSVERARV